MLRFFLIASVCLLFISLPQPTPALQSGQKIFVRDERREFELGRILQRSQTSEVWQATEQLSNKIQVLKIFFARPRENLINVHSLLFAVSQSSPERMSHLQIYEPAEAKLPSGVITPVLITVLRTTSLQYLYPQIFLIDSEVLKSGTVHQRLRLLAQLWNDGLTSLRQLHAVNIVHTDINPGNWLLTGPVGEVVAGRAGFRLSDFDYAGPSGRDISGYTRFYMAPEIQNFLAGDPSGHRSKFSDHFSFAAVLYETIFGLPPTLHFILNTAANINNITEAALKLEAQWFREAASNPDGSFPKFLEFVNLQLSWLKNKIRPQISTAEFEQFLEISRYILSALQSDEASRAQGLDAIEGANKLACRL